MISAAREYTVDAHVIDPRIVVVPLNRVILDRAMALTTIPEMHDRLIVSTAMLRA
jgi:hypothetical protein